MSLVRYAMVCDHCQTRQEEYAGYLSCVNCNYHTCEKYADVYDHDPPGLCVCRACALEAETA